MRIKILILFFVLIISACAGPKRLMVNPYVTFKLPRNARPVTYDQALSQFPNLSDKSLLEVMRHLYVIDGMLVGLSEIHRDTAFAIPPFSEYKFVMTSVYKQNKNTVNDITLENYNGHQFVITDYIVRNDNLYQFSPFDNYTAFTFGGFIRYENQQDKANANQLLKNILNNIDMKFNNTTNKRD